METNVVKSVGSLNYVYLVTLHDLQNTVHIVLLHRILCLAVKLREHKSRWKSAAGCRASLSSHLREVHISLLSPWCLSQPNFSHICLSRPYSWNQVSCICPDLFPLSIQSLFWPLVLSSVLASLITFSIKSIHLFKHTIFNFNNFIPLHS